ncbi:MAG: hypothetical protein GX969_02850 [Firmicutes bacterium]|nr:hypothetical protein [Bacillota bacterium]
MELTVRDSLHLGDLCRAKVIAGTKGLSNIIRHVSVIEVPDAYRWCKGHELFITAFYSLKEDIQGQLLMIQELKANNAAALAICYPKLYMEGIAEALIDKANELALPILELPNDVAYVNIIDPVLEEIAKRRKRALEYALRISRLFTQMTLRGADIRELLQILSRELRAPVIVLDRDYVVLNSYNPGGMPVPQCIAKYLTGKLDRRLTHILKIIRNYREPTRHFIRTHPGERIGCVAMPIIIDDACEGFLVAFEIHEQLNETSLAAIEHACVGLSIIMMKKKIITETELRMQGDLMDDIVSNRYPEETILDRAERLGLNLSSKRIVIVATVDMENDQCDIALSYGKDRISHIYIIIKETLRRENQNNVILLRGKQIVILPELGEASDGESAKIRASNIADLINRSLSVVQNIPRVRIGIGRYHQQLSDLAVSYRQAKSAVILGKYFLGDKSIVCFDEIESIDLFLASLNATQAEEYVKTTLGPLLDHDLKYNAELIKTLEACFQHGDQSQKVADSLHIHRNTLSYRKQNIRKFLNIDPFVGHDRFRVQMALILRRLLLKQLFHTDSNL